MNLHTELPKLIDCYQLKKTRCSFNLRHIKARLAVVTKKIDLLMAEEQALLTILKHKKLSGSVSLSTLREFQRAEAVIKRKMADIRIQMRTNLLKKDKLTVESEQLKKEFKLCHFKLEKYLLLNKKVEWELLQKRNTMEELTIEELNYG